MVKLLVLVFCIVCLSTACTKKQTLLNGSLEGVDFEKVYLYSYNQKEPIDSVTVNNNHFTFDLTNIEPQMVWLGYRREGGAFFTTNKSFEVKILKKQEAVYVDVKNNKVEKIRREYFNFLNSIPQKSQLDRIAKKKYQASNEDNKELVKQLNVQYDALLEDYNKIKNTYADSLIHLYMNQPIGAYIYHQNYVYFKEFFDEEKYRGVRDFVNKLKKNGNTSIYVDQVLKDLGFYKHARVGLRAPEILGTSLSGEVKKLSDLRGNYVIVDFWASWCGWCRKETPYLKQALKLANIPNAKIFGVSFDANEKDWKNAIEEDDSDWDHIRIAQEDVKALKAKYGIRGIPHLILVNPEGVIIQVKIRGEKVENAFVL